MSGMKSAEEWAKDVPFTEWDLGALLRRVQDDARADFLRTFAGHVYVKDDDYAALCRAAKEPEFIRELQAERITLTARVKALETGLAWYADAENYEGPNWGGDTTMGDYEIFADGGDRARNLLTQGEKG